MIVTPSNLIGLDKVRLFIQDYGISDATKSGFLIQPATVDLSTGMTNDELLFKDRYGVEVKGSKAFRNTEIYQATVNGRGLVVQFNPSKPYHPFNLVDNDKVFNERVQTVFNDLMSKGVRASWNDAKLSRLDIARNILLSGSVQSYGVVWPWINQKRSMHTRQYPDGYGTGNDSWGTIFYDKGKESGHDDIKNFLRGEIQLKRGRTITDMIGCKNIGQLFDLGLGSIQDVYRTTMQEKVLRITDGANQHTIQYHDEIEVLQMLKAKSDRTAISKHIQLMGMPYFLETYRSPEVYADVLIQAGFSRMTVNRTLKVVRKQIELYGMIYQDKRSTVGKMLREITHKLVA